jgi:hypothetical protein
MELGFVESDREKPLVKIINNLGGWEVLRSFNLYSWDSHRVLKRLHAEYYVNAFFRVEVVADVRDPARNIIRISPDGLGMPHKSFYHRLPTDPAVQAYQTFLKDSAQLFGAARYESQFRSPDFLFKDPFFSGKNYCLDLLAHRKTRKFTKFVRSRVISRY